jgi:hypothetical protein
LVVLGREWQQRYGEGDDLGVVYGGLNQECLLMDWNWESVQREDSR